jgi:hypothetical protein
MNTYLMTITSDVKKYFCKSLKFIQREKTTKKL